jgi:hypothetical protein
LQRRADVRRRATDHPARLLAHGLHAAGQLVDRDDGRLEQHDAFTAARDDRVRGAEVDRELPSAPRVRESHLAPLTASTPPHAE